MFALLCFLFEMGITPRADVVFIWEMSWVRVLNDTFEKNQQCCPDILSSRFFLKRLGFI